MTTKQERKDAAEEAKQAEAVQVERAQAEAAEAEALRVSDAAERQGEFPPAPTAVRTSGPTTSEEERLRGLLSRIMNNPDLPRPIASMITEELRKRG